MVAEGDINVLPDGSDVPYRKIFYGNEERLHHQLPDISEAVQSVPAANVFHTVHNHILKTAGNYMRRPYVIKRSDAHRIDPTVAAQDVIRSNGYKAIFRKAPFS